MSRKSGKIAALIAGCQGQPLDAHYLGYFECFNRGLFYEAHDVLEELWLPSRGGANDAFYKGLIQLAGAFVHLQKHGPKHHRLRPAAALFRLAHDNLRGYPTPHERLAISGVLALIADWTERLKAGGFKMNPLHAQNHPVLQLDSAPPHPR